MNDSIERINTAGKQIEDWTENWKARVQAIERRFDDMEAIGQRPAQERPETRELCADEDRGFLRKSEKVADHVTADLPDGIKASEISIARILKGIATGGWKGAEAEKRVLSYKALGTTPDTAGGYTVPDIVSANVIDLARASSTFIRAGAKTLPVAAHERLPKLTQDPTGTWKAENKPATSSGISFGAISLNARLLMFLVYASIELLEDAATQMDGFISQVIGKALAVEIDRVAYTGNGIAEPHGLWNVPGVGSVAGGGALTGFGKFLSAAQAIYEANYAGDYSGLSIIMPPRTGAALAGLTNSLGDALRPPDEYQRMAKFTTTQMPKNLGAGSNESAVIVGDFTQAVLATKTPMIFEATNAAAGAFESGQVAFRGYCRVDVAALRPAFFTKITGVTN